MKPLNRIRIFIKSFRCFFSPRMLNDLFPSCVIILVITSYGRKGNELRFLINDSTYANV